MKSSWITLLCAAILIAPLQVHMARIPPSNFRGRSSFATSAQANADDGDESTAAWEASKAQRENYQPRSYSKRLDGPNSRDTIESPVGLGISAIEADKTFPKSAINQRGSRKSSETVYIPVVNNGAFSDSRKPRILSNSRRVELDVKKSEEITPNRGNRQTYVRQRQFSPERELPVSSSKYNMGQSIDETKLEFFNLDANSGHTESYSRYAKRPDKSKETDTTVIREKVSRGRSRFRSETKEGSTTTPQPTIGSRNKSSIRSRPTQRINAEALYERTSSAESTTFRSRNSFTTRAQTTTNPTTTIRNRSNFRRPTTFSRSTSTTESTVVSNANRRSSTVDEDDDNIPQPLSNKKTTSPLLAARLSRKKTTDSLEETTSTKSVKGRGNYRPNLKAERRKSNSEDESSIDDYENENYPEHFKMLLAKERTTKSPKITTQEILSTKSSQRVTNVRNTNSDVSRLTNPSLSKYSKFRTAKLAPPKIKSVDTIINDSDGLPSDRHDSFESKEAKEDDKPVTSSYIDKWEKDKATTEPFSVVESTQPTLPKNSKYEYKNKFNATRYNLRQRKSEIETTSEKTLTSPKLTRPFRGRSNFPVQTTTDETPLSFRIDLNQPVASKKLTENEIKEKAVKTQSYLSKYKSQTLTTKRPVVTIKPIQLKSSNSRYNPTVIQRKSDIGNDNFLFDVKDKDTAIIHNKENAVSDKPVFIISSPVPIQPGKKGNRFSSRYKGPFSRDSPVYRPTVPTVTPTTDIIEENDLFPGLEVISFSQPRSTPASDSLKTAETVMMVSKLINVETSNHSPSVTVSIFDALAEILTSTSKPISSTISTTSTEKIKSETYESTIDNTIGVSTMETYSSSEGEFSERDDISSESTPGVQSEDRVSQLTTTTKPVQLSVNTEMGTTVITPQSTTISQNTKKPTLELHAQSLSLTQALENITSTQTNHESPLDSIDPALTTFKPIAKASDRKPFATLILYSITTTTFNNDSNSTDSMSLNNSDTDAIDAQNINFSSSEKNDVQNLIVSGLNSFETTTVVQNNDNVDENLKSNIVETIDSTTETHFSETEKSIVGSLTIINNSSTLELMNSSLNTVTEEIFITDTPLFTIQPLVESRSHLDVLIKTNDTASSHISALLTPVLDKSGFSRRAKLLRDIEKIISDNNIESLFNVTLSGSVLPNELTLISSTVDNIINDNNNQESTSIGVTPESTLSDIQMQSTIPINLHSTTEPALAITTEPALASTTEPTLLISTNNYNQNIERVDETTVVQLNVINPPHTESISATEFDDIISVTTEVISDSSTLSMENITLTPDITTESTTELFNSSEYLTTEDTATLITPLIQTTDISTLSTQTNNTNTPLVKMNNFSTTTPTYEWIPPFPTAWKNKPINETSQNEVINQNRNEMTLPKPPKKDYYIYGILPNNTVVRKNPNDNQLEVLTEASPYIIFGLLPNNTIIRRFPNGTELPTVTQRIDVLPINPKSLRNPNNPVYRNPDLVKPINYNADIVTTNEITQKLSTQYPEKAQITDKFTQTKAAPVNMSYSMDEITKNNNIDVKTNVISQNGLNENLYGKQIGSTESNVINLLTTAKLPSIEDILESSISAASKEEAQRSTTSTTTPQYLTLDIDPETKLIRTEKPSNGSLNKVFRYKPVPKEILDTNIENENINKESAIQKITTSKPTNSKTIKTTTLRITTMNIDDLNESNEIISDANPTSDSNVFLRGGFLDSTTYRNIQENKASQGSFVTSTEDIVTKETDDLNSQKVYESLSFDKANESFNEYSTSSKTTSYNVPQFSEISTRQIENINLSTTTHIPITPNPNNERLTTRTKPSVSTQRRPTTKTTTSPTTTRKLTTEKAISSTTTQRRPTTISTSTTLNRQNIREQNSRTRTISHSEIENYVSTTSSNLMPTITTPIDTTKKRKITNNKSTINLETSTLKPASSTYSIDDDINFLNNLQKLVITNPNDDKERDIANRIIALAVEKNLAELKNGVTTTTKKPKNSNEIRKNTKLSTERNIFSSTTEIKRPVSDNLQLDQQDITTLKPKTSTYSVNDDIAFLTSLRKLATPQPSNKEQALANRIIALAVDKNLAELKNNFTTTTPKSHKKVQSNSYTEKYIEPSSTQYFITPSYSKIQNQQTTIKPETSTHSVEDDIAFLSSLRKLVTQQTSNKEQALTNKIIALAVDKNLEDINKSTSSKATTTTIAPTTQKVIAYTRSGKNLNTKNNLGINSSQSPTPEKQLSENDLLSLQNDVQLLQKLLSVDEQTTINAKQTTIKPLTLQDTEVKLLQSLLSNPSINDKNIGTESSKRPSSSKRPIASTERVKVTTTEKRITSTTPPPRLTTQRASSTPSIQEDLKNFEQDTKLLQALLQIQGGAKPSSTLKPDQNEDKTLEILLNNNKKSATESPLKVSTEYGKTNDAILAAILKERGIGPATPENDIQEQLKLAALLNQVIVTPKVKPRPTTRPPPPPPPARQSRPILDGLAWLWQQWQETAPGPRGTSPSQSTSNSGGGLFFGSGPFIGNADEVRDTRQSTPGNRVPLPPPQTTENENGPGRGQLITAAINVTRAFSQFLGAAIQGAAQTFQSVFRAGTRTASDYYGSGSG